jgi:hypothetical protein
MNFAQQMIARGASVLATQSPQSELFTVEETGEKVWANCNRIPGSSDPEGTKNVSTEEGSEIEWPLGTGTIPKRGTNLIDSFGCTHRTQSVKHIGHALKLKCEVTR